MARRGSPGRGRRRAIGDDRPYSLGAHWRADGAPKTSYSSQGEALSVADELRQDTGADLNVYRCQHCSGWHMGSAGGRDR